MAAEESSHRDPAGQGHALSAAGPRKTVPPCCPPPPPQNWRSWPEDGLTDGPLRVIAASLAAQDAGPVGKNYYLPLLERNLYKLPLLAPVMAVPPPVLICAKCGDVREQSQEQINLAVHQDCWSCPPLAPLSGTKPSLSADMLLKFVGLGGCSVFDTNVE